MAAIKPIPKTDPTKYYIVGQVYIKYNKRPDLMDEIYALKSATTNNLQSFIRSILNDNKKYWTNLTNVVDEMSTYYILVNGLIV